MGKEKEEKKQERKKEHEWHYEEVTQRRANFHHLHFRRQGATKYFVRTEPL